ncbi:hypothetical protein BFAG_02894 [Bacteroides fragilis 3_1_12]|uniref:Uncharacterized protein n=2 Tax=root TaxID=1 RepID=A0ABN0BMU0_BACFG|nr:hypothetical protein BFAG_02894 [Bacteroides fragilis 3_1_12]DAE06027.1 MAG TPA: hypothetical protein [Siphoviridae sp. ctEgn5]
MGYKLAASTLITIINHSFRKLLKKHLKILTVYINIRQTTCRISFFY